MPVFRTPGGPRRLSVPCCDVRGQQLSSVRDQEAVEVRQVRFVVFDAVAGPPGWRSFQAVSELKGAHLGGVHAIEAGEREFDLVQTHAAGGVVMSSF